MTTASTWGDVLQPRTGEVAGDHYVSASIDQVFWGELPHAGDRAVLSIEPGESVTFDTLSHEGLLEDQGRDPLAFFTRQGVPEDAVLTDAIAVAAEVTHDPAGLGPHVVTGPVEVRGAAPGDLLAIRVDRLLPRVPYGVISNRHGKGALTDRFPEHDHTVSVFATAHGATAHRDAAHWDTAHRATTHQAVGRAGESTAEAAPEDARHARAQAFGRIPRSGPDAVALATRLSADEARAAREERAAQAHVDFPLAPFLGIMGVASDTAERLHSVPPGAHGGNIDITLLTEGATLLLPVQVPGALAYVGDPHFAQGDGEVSLTAMEASLRATVTFDVVPAAEAERRFGPVSGPIVVTDEFLVPTGMDRDLDIAVQHCVTAAISLLEHRYGMDSKHAYAYLSAATDFNISQVVDIVKGVHARIRLADFADTAAALLGKGSRDDRV